MNMSALGNGQLVRVVPRRGKSTARISSEKHAAPGHFNTVFT